MKLFIRVMRSELSRAGQGYTDARPLSVFDEVGRELAKFRDLSFTIAGDVPMRFVVDRERSHAEGALIVLVVEDGEVMGEGVSVNVAPAQPAEPVNPGSGG